MSTYEITYQSINRHGRRGGPLCRRRVQAESAVRARIAFEDRLGTASALIVEVQELPAAARRQAPAAPALPRTAGLIDAALAELGQAKPRQAQAAA